MLRRVMWIENKSGDGLSGPARIGWVNVLNSGKRLDYGDQRFRTLRGRGFKANYEDVKTGDTYWISGCRKDGFDALYSTLVDVDEDALEEYWINIRNKPENIGVTTFRASSKC